MNSYRQYCVAVVTLVAFMVLAAWSVLPIFSLSLAAAAPIQAEHAADREGKRVDRESERTDAVPRIGPPLMFLPDVNRNAEALKNPADQNYPIKQLTVTRQTYFKWLEFSGHLNYVQQATQHGQYGPRHFMPVLAKYVESGEPAYGQACLEMLKTFDVWIRAEVQRTGWHSLFCEEIGYIGFYRNILKKHGLLSEEKDIWLRELIVFMARNIHAWNSADTYWRGPMHRAQGEGILKGLAAEWFPDVPEAQQWRTYSEDVYQDWWHCRDFAANDVHYFSVGLQPLFLAALLRNDREFFNDPQMKKVWERLLFEVSPDGSIPPYGAHNGWNSSAGNRIAMLEILASKTGDGRYRYVAHRLMNYLLYQRLAYRSHHMLLGPESTEPLALAYLLADDTIEPKMPFDGSQIVLRKETIRLASHGDKKGAAEILGPDANLDPAPDRGLIDCAMLLTKTPKPSKLILRSGWNPGDFFVLVDLFPRHDPLNPSGILGMTRWGAALTSTIAAKGDSDENRIVIRQLNAGSVANRPAAPPETEIDTFVESKFVSYAAIRVSNYDAAPVDCTRHFLFIKNDCLLVRDEVHFNRTLNAQVASVFNTQNIGPQISSHAATTYMSQPVASGVGLLNPPVDLLVYFCPQPDLRMEVIDRTAADVRSADIPAQLRHVWQGAAEKDQTIHFSMLLRPQTPHSHSRNTSTNRTEQSKENAPSHLNTDSIAVLLNDSDASVIRLESGPERQQWVVINPRGKKLDLPDCKTDAVAAYVVLRGQEDPLCWAHKASVLSVAGRRISIPLDERTPTVDVLQGNP